MGDQRVSRVFVYCDDISHGGRVAVTAFCPADPARPDRERWEEWCPSPARASGLTITGGETANRRYRMECRKCGAGTAAALPEETLFEVLSVLAEHDVSHVTLAALAALMSHDAAGPEL